MLNDAGSAHPFPSFPRLIKNFSVRSAIPIITPFCFSSPRKYRRFPREDFRISIRTRGDGDLSDKPRVIRTRRRTIHIL